MLNIETALPLDAANIIDSDTDIFNGRLVSVNMVG